MSEHSQGDPNILQQLVMLRHDYRTSLQTAFDPEEKRRLYRVIQELNACIERLQQGRSS